MSLHSGSLEPWSDLDPNDFTQWWKKHYIVNPTKFITKKNKDNIYAYFVIQDTTLTGICWHLSYWYYDDPNRYVEKIYNWCFDKELTKLKSKDVVSLKNKDFLQKTKSFKSQFVSQNGNRMFIIFVYLTYLSVCWLDFHNQGPLPTIFHSSSHMHSIWGCSHNQRKELCQC